MATQTLPVPRDGAASSGRDRKALLAERSARESVNRANRWYSIKLYLFYQSVSIPLHTGDHLDVMAQNELDQLKDQLTVLQNAFAAQQTQLTSDPESSGAVCRVAAKLPPFWPDRPTVWFNQVESQFNLSKITVDETKFHHVVCALETRYAAAVEDILDKPPATGKYDLLKKELIRSLSLSEEQRVRNLLGKEELGDRTPSQFLRHLKSLAGSIELPDSILRSLWLQRLPPHAQAILQAQSSVSMDIMAETADKILEVPFFTPPSGVNAIAPTSPLPTPTGTVSLSVSEQIQELSRQIAALHTRLPPSRQTDSFPPRGRNRRRSRDRRSQDASPQYSPDREAVCYYHRRFGSDARRCTRPCAFPGNANGSM